MMKDKAIISEKQLAMGVILRRVINASGEPYSLIIEDGVEMFSAPTYKEDEMIKMYYYSIS